MLQRIVASREAHARFVNTLARLEYVGRPKDPEEPPSEHIDLDGLQHILDEAVHALRLKKAAVALAGSGDGVFTFADGATLAGNAGEAYLQALDRLAEEMLVDLPADDRGDANYRLTSAAIEVRPRSSIRLRRVPARQRRRVLGRGDLRRTRTATWRKWRPGWSRRCPTGARGWKRCSAPRRCSTPVS